MFSSAISVSGLLRIPDYFKGLTIPSRRKESDSALVRGILAKYIVHSVDAGLTLEMHRNLNFAYGY